MFIPGFVCQTHTPRLALVGASPIVLPSGDDPTNASVIWGSVTDNRRMLLDTRKNPVSTSE